jgi:hypothetical protein
MMLDRNLSHLESLVNKTLFWVQVFTHQLICVRCAGNTHMFGWMAVNKEMRHSMYLEQTIRCSVCGVFQ